MLYLAGSAAALVGAGLAVASPDLTLRVTGALLVLVGVAALVASHLRRGEVAPTAVAGRDSKVAEAELAQVTEQALRLAQGKELTVEGKGAALEALHQVADKMTTMVKARVHIMATERDLEQARRMYRQILPLASATDHGTLSLAGACQPAAETGGDWWTYRKLGDGKMLLVIGDATGHGVHSAMVGCMAHGAVKALNQLGENYLSVRSVVDAVHTAIRIPGVKHSPMTLFVATIDPTSGVVQYMNHGHVFPLIAVRDASGTITAVTSITGDANVDEENMEDSLELEIRTGTAKLGPGNILICFTDGLIERAKDNGRPFGIRRLQNVLLGASAPGGVDGMTGLRDQILQKVEDYVERAPVDDDVTIVLCGVAAAARVE